MCYYYSTKFPVCGCLWTEWSARCCTTRTKTSTSTPTMTSGQDSDNETHCAGHKMVSVTYPDQKCEMCRTSPSLGRSGTYRGSKRAGRGERDYGSVYAPRPESGSAFATAHKKSSEVSNGADRERCQDMLTPASAYTPASAPAPALRFEEMDMDVSRVCDVVSGRRVKVRRGRTTSDGDDERRNPLPSFRNV